MSDEATPKDKEALNEVVGKFGTPPIPPNSGAMLRQVFGAAESDVFCSFDPTTPVGMVMMDRCAEAPDAKVKDLVNLQVLLVHVYGHHVDLVDEKDGSVRTALRTCLVDKEGKVYSCVSEGVRNSILRLSAQHGLPPWRNGIRVKVQLKSLGNNRQWLTILNDPLPVEGKGKR